MKIATWNVNSLTVRLPQVLDWLAANPVDVLALQETKKSLCEIEAGQADMARLDTDLQRVGHNPLRMDAASPGG